MSTFAERLAIIEERIAAACRRAGRSRDEVRLMAVSKTHPAEALEEAVAAGVRLFGENRVQEFERKKESLTTAVRAGAEREGIEVHLIGHLQSNKTAKAAKLFSGVDTVDSVKVAERLSEAALALGVRLPILVEIKLSGEAAKTGASPDSDELRMLFERAADLEGIEVRGVMTVPPLDDNPETARACFRQLRSLKEGWAQTYPKLSFEELSMGMSGDFEIGIEEGSTLVRIGTALFGKREYPVA
ncbi:YggS family pyridoxal phosphate-dependent enzyme [Silvibacterium dinghuense]|uniref:Pyridoxal phosphate homeostasis protein n=1 Tax=Silvibacterium dinghuense TaxID=1560006 RepID=A0A4Q1S9W1_9BACT|nr:YggS family pyridoxal phosphate-dependent enzyme [Silvibacterium dinghuense]RXS93715.1 YggS family pyridoxal phosphate-dependent enzyme [Silvibacterium dinghuense]GGH07092.1 YggS family pyridoxal phosphate enzyme [Silvibacterium dinghuense]